MSIRIHEIPCPRPGADAIDDNSVHMVSTFQMFAIYLIYFISNTRHIKHWWSVFFRQQKQNQNQQKK